MHLGWDMTKDEIFAASQLVIHMIETAQRFFGEKNHRPMSLEQAQIIALACDMCKQELIDDFRERGN